MSRVGGEGVYHDHIFCCLLFKSSSLSSKVLMLLLLKGLSPFMKMVKPKLLEPVLAFPKLTEFEPSFRHNLLISSIRSFVILVIYLEDCHLDVLQLFLDSSLAIKEQLKVALS